MLRLADHDVRVARDGQEAVELAAAFRPALALLDIGMPRMNGYEAARRIRTPEGGTEVLLIAVTGWGSRQTGGVHSKPVSTTTSPSRPNSRTSSS